MRYLIFSLILLLSLSIVFSKEEDDDGVSVQIAKDDEEDASKRAEVDKKGDNSASEQHESTDKSNGETSKPADHKETEENEDKDDKTSKKQFGCGCGGSCAGINLGACGCGCGKPQGCNGGPPGFYPGDLWEYPYPYYHPVYNMGTAYCPCACITPGPGKDGGCAGATEGKEDVGAQDTKEGFKIDVLQDKAKSKKKKSKKQLVPSHYYGCPSAGWGGFYPGHTGGGWGAPYWYKSNIPNPNSASKKFGISVHGDHDIGAWDHGWGAGYGHPWGAPVADSAYLGGFSELSGSQYGGYSHGVNGWGAGNNIGLLGWGNGWSYPAGGDIGGWGGSLPHGWGEGLHHAGGQTYAWGTGLTGHHPEEGWADTGHRWPEGITSLGVNGGTPYGHHGLGGLYKSKVPSGKEEGDKATTKSKVNDSETTNEKPQEKNDKSA